jgi:hypothetical protein
MTASGSSCHLPTLDQEARHVCFVSMCSCKVPTWSSRFKNIPLQVCMQYLKWFLHYWVQDSHRVDGEEFWNVIPCILVEVQGRLEGKHSLHLQCRRVSQAITSCCCNPLRWRWRRCVYPERQCTTRLHGIKSKRTVIFWITSLIQLQVLCTVAQNSNIIVTGE